MFKFIISSMLKGLVNLFRNIWAIEKFLYVKRRSSSSSHVVLNFQEISHWQMRVLWVFFFFWDGVGIWKEESWVNIWETFVFVREFEMELKGRLEFECRWQKYVKLWSLNAAVICHWVVWPNKVRLYLWLDGLVQCVENLESASIEVGNLF